MLKQVLRLLIRPVPIPLHRAVLGDAAIVLIVIRFVKLFIEGWNS